ncbi:MAG: hypothetical protein E8D41_11550 [Nitrospira sp.]|nr:MAG: hypothetical protein E8D41_11550 [Nitrospira sp.]
MSRFRDIIEVLHDTNLERVRLSGIDCSEKGQAYGKQAKQAAAALVFGKDVILQTHGQDTYEHTLADVVLSDGMNVNHELVKEGCAGGIGRMHLEIQSLKGWRRRHETLRKACGSILRRFPCGSMARLGAVKRLICQTSCR